MRRGIDFIRRAGEEPTFRRQALLQSAGLRFARALTHDPTHREAYFHLGYVLGQAEVVDDEGNVTRRDGEAIAAFEALRALDPTYRAEEVGYELGLLHTRTGNLAQAIAAYEAGIEASLRVTIQTSVAHSNLAEVRMMSGDLIGAVADYERAIAIAGEMSGSPWRRNPNSDAQALGLPLFGLAVALDRLGERNESRARAVRAVRVSGGTTSMLHSDNVFFEPESEVFYYEAVAQEAIASTTSGRARNDALAEARHAWRTYLRLASDDDPWRELVEERLEAIPAP